MIYILLLIILILLIIFYCIFSKLKFYNYKIEKFELKEKEIPKIIWSYWENSDIPILVKDCIENWKRLNPDWKINFLNDSNLKDFLDVDILSFKFANTPQRKSDFVRLHLLDKYGGVWMDSSIVLKQNLDWVIQTQKEKNCEIVGFYIDFMTKNCNYPIIENWFIASVKNSSFIRNWKNKFIEINNFKTPEEYVKFIKSEKVDLQGIKGTSYLTMHVAAQYVIQKKNSVDEVKKKLCLFKAESGPFEYLVSNDWNPTRSFDYLCNNKEKKTPFHKLRGGERNFALKHYEKYNKCLFKN